MNGSDDIEIQEGRQTPVEDRIDKVYLQCGYEDECKNKDCLKCNKRKQKYNISLSLAEVIVIEEFATLDLEVMIKEKPKEVELMQEICHKIMKKIFRSEK